MWSDSVVLFLSFMKFNLTAFRRTATVLAIMLAGLGVAWGLLWSVAAREYRSVIDSWIETGRKSGYEILYDSQTLSGFPHNIVLRFTNLRWKNTDGITFQAGAMALSSRPWLWRHFDARLSNHVEIRAPLDEEGYALILGGESGHARVSLDSEGLWTVSHVALSKAKVGRAPDYIFEAEELEASAERPTTPPKDFKQTGLTLEGEAEDVKLPEAMPSPFGSKMKQVEAKLRFMGAMPDVRKKYSMTVWNNGGGIVEFDRLHMEWGPLDMTAKGAIGFDDDLQPEGAFSGAVDNHQQVLKALMEHELIAKRQAAMLDSALSLFAKPASLADSSGIEIPITVQLGGLFLGPVRVFMFPEIEWSKAASVPAAVPAPAAPAPVIAPEPAPPVSAPPPAVEPAPTPAPAPQPPAEAKPPSAPAPAPTPEPTPKDEPAAEQPEPEAAPQT
ncbi:MAG: DUF2125 domain-containing protein [Alphaproteobacteria bacterium]|nr:DUF2125 domain-containing protein [Alphaproteobacteria bacterium]